MRRGNWTIAFYMLLVFVSGIAVGGFGYRSYASKPQVDSAPKPSPEEWRKQYLTEMTNRLRLTPDQLSKLNAILDETHARYQASREKHDAEIKTIKGEQIDKVRAMLTDEQRPEYEKLHADREARAKAAKK